MHVYIQLPTKGIETKWYKCIEKKNEVIYMYVMYTDYCYKKKPFWTINFCWLTEKDNTFVNIEILNNLICLLHLLNVLYQYLIVYEICSS